MKSINAIIKKATLDAENYNCITLNLVLDVANGGGVCFGGIKLGDITPSDNARESDCQYMAWYISKVLQVVDVKSIDALVGKPVRAIFENKGCCGDSCIGLQHFLFDSIFFIPKYVNNPRIDFGGLFAYDENYKTVEELSRIQNFITVSDGCRRSKKDVNLSKNKTINQINNNMRARTNLTGAVEGSLVIFEGQSNHRRRSQRQSFSVPLRSGNGVNLNLWLDKTTGKEYGFFASRKELDEANKEFFKKMKAYNKAVADYDRTVTTLVKLESAKLEVKDYIIQKVEKRKYQVLVVFPNSKTIIDKTFKSITAANEWCALHLKKI